MSINFSITNPRGTLREVGRSGQRGRGNPAYYHVDTSGLPESYADLVAANPYLKFDYTPGFWDHIGNFFGFRTREDKFREEMQQASREYETQLLSMAREEKYNSPIEQAARQRQAGINPDLNGVGQDSASEYNEPETHPVPPDPGEFLENAGNVFSAAISAFGIVKDLSLLKGISLDNANKQFENIRGLFSTVRDYIAGTNTPDALFGTGSGVASPLSDDENVRKVFEENLRQFIPSKRVRRNFSRAIIQTIGSASERGSSYEAVSSSNESRKKALRSQSFFQGIADAAAKDGELGVNDLDIMDTKLFKRVSRYEWKLYKAKQKLEMKQAKIASHEERSKGAQADLDVATSQAKLAAGVPDAQAQAELQKANLDARSAEAELEADVPGVRASNEFWRLSLQKAMNQYAYEIRSAFYDLVHESFKADDPASKVFLMSLLGGETFQSTISGALGKLF